jgi:3'-phosphoadenosine 5'-phosphosulfate sulfotransferase (PAPS reductase)/FAD synthetase
LAHSAQAPERVSAPNPYYLEGPSLISFSGGRTSGYMLWHILDAHDGKLPEDVHVCFANTGKEREETLRFVHECGVRWGVHVRWLEATPHVRGAPRRMKPEQRFAEVGYNSASRNGEPLVATMLRKQFVPNVAMRFCTIETKIKVMIDFMRAHGYKYYLNAVGLRADELRRIVKGQRRNEQGVDPYTTCWPMLKAGVTRKDVWSFWLGANSDPKHLTHPLPRGFDLGLYPYEGNCDGCFLKGRDILKHQERERPGYLNWWINAEQQLRGVTRDPAMSQFDKDWTYEQLQREVDDQPLLVPLDPRSLEFDAECGVSGTDTSIRCGRRAA